MKIDLDAQGLDIIIQSMKAAQVKGDAAIEFGKLLDKLSKALEKEVVKISK